VNNSGQEGDGKRGLDEMKREALGFPEFLQDLPHRGGKAFFLGEDGPMADQPPEVLADLPSGMSPAKGGEEDEEQGAEQEPPKEETAGKADGGIEETEVMIGMADPEMKVDAMALQGKEGRDEGGYQDDPGQ
jgi:hypothetical protein